MDTDVLRGEGSLCSSDDAKEFISAITYQLWEKPQAENAPGEWWGNLALDRLIDSGEYIIELEDGRKGTCSIRANIQRVPGRGTIYRYSLPDSLLRRSKIK